MTARPAAALDAPWPGTERRPTSSVPPASQPVSPPVLRLRLSERPLRPEQARSRPGPARPAFRPPAAGQPLQELPQVSRVLSAPRRASEPWLRQAEAAPQPASREALEPRQKRVGQTSVRRDAVRSPRRVRALPREPGSHPDPARGASLFRRQPVSYGRGRSFGAPCPARPAASATTWSSGSRSKSSHQRCSVHSLVNRPRAVSVAKTGERQSRSPARVSLNPR